MGSHINEACSRKDYVLFSIVLGIHVDVLPHLWRIPSLLRCSLISTIRHVAQSDLVIHPACMYTYSTLFNRLTHSACALSVLLPLASSVSPLPPRLRRPRLRRPRLSSLSSSCPPIPASSPLTRYLSLPTGFRCLGIALITRLMTCLCPCLGLSML